MANPMKDGEVREVWGSGSKPYQLKCIGRVNPCTCAEADTRAEAEEHEALARVGSICDL